MSDEHATPTESLTPYSGDRGWKGLERSAGEGAFFAIVAALLVVAVLAGVTMGVAGVGVVFVLLTFVSLAALVLISIGQ
ncbi:hypothetical protein CLV78_102193 [Aliiruegeria haliotis]|uniref:Aa3 type cytochrome c oxidase subunit IV n=1 Tax=Aliiruegeria haliotis TaxID=1280846 RepID=A0A2T0RUY6_9RHOB|nr:hypothetical protein [Aliiruegeria haliotis]PRY25016.1 hypothetical protein CLV78_102193 [Aliiruegeria haliotis]